VPSLYELLGVPADADTEAIHRAYRAAARRLHPDTAFDGAAADDEAMRQLNEAWAVLRDPELRAEYDEIIGLDPADLADGAERPGPPRWARRAPLVVILAVLLAIFILTAYAAVPPSGR
jgi:curved DNA-binding protein CbpA